MLLCLDIAGLSITAELARGEPLVCASNPTDRLIHSERSPNGGRCVWIGKSITVLLGHRPRGQRSPWLAIDRLF